MNKRIRESEDFAEGYGSMIVFETFIGTRESAIIMPPFTQKLLALENPFRVFRVFRGSFDEFWYSKKENPLAKAKGLHCNYIQA